MSDETPLHEGDCDGIERENAQTDSNAKGESGGNQSQPTISIVAGTKSQMPPAPSQGTHSDCQTSKRHPEPPNWCEITMLVAEVIGIAGLVWYCVINLHELSVFKEESNTMQSEFLASQNNAIMDERAWVATMTVTSEFMLGKTNEREGVYFYITIKNTGKTPAINVVPWISEYTDLKNVPKTDLYPKPVYHSLLLAPNGENVIPTSSDINLSMSRYRIIKDEGEYFMAGTIWYDDIYHRHHWTQFCFSVGSDFVSITYPPTHNTCDDTQTNQPN